MTNNDPLPRLTKKHNMSRSLWSSLPVTALLRGQQYESKESFLSAAKRDQDEEREREKEDFRGQSAGGDVCHHDHNAGTDGYDKV